MCDIWRHLMSVFYIDFHRVAAIWSFFDRIARCNRYDPPPLPRFYPQPGRSVARPLPVRASRPRFSPAISMAISPGADGCPTWCKVRGIAINT